MLNPAYGPLLKQLRKPLLCPAHALQNCSECLQQWIDTKNSELIEGFEQLLGKVAAEDARYEVDNVGDDNDTNEE